jgi:hypothetical protein
MHKLTIAALSASAFFATLTTAGCARTTSAWYPRTPISADVITAAEISRGSPQNAYSALEQLRPFFLRPRPSGVDVRGLPPRMHVFIDGAFSGDLDVLKMIPASEIESITRVQPSMAFTTMGAIRASDGVLMVRLRCRGAC